MLDVRMRATRHDVSLHDYPARIVVGAYIDHAYLTAVPNEVAEEETARQANPWSPNEVRGISR
jgi:hypothetical protein